MGTTTTAACSPEWEGDRLWLNGKEEDASAERIQNCLREIRARAGPGAPQGGLRIVSNNNFPTAAGLASSASGYACLVAALGYLHGIVCPTPGVQAPTVARAPTSHLFRRRPLACWSFVHMPLLSPSSSKALIWQTSCGMKADGWAAAWTGWGPLGCGEAGLRLSMPIHVWWICEVGDGHGSRWIGLPCVPDGSCQPLAFSTRPDPVDTPPSSELAATPSNLLLEYCMHQVSSGVRI